MGMPIGPEELEDRDAYAKRLREIDDEIAQLEERLGVLRRTRTCYQWQLRDLS